MNYPAELARIRRRVVSDLCAVDALKEREKPLPPAFQFIRADIVRLLNTLDHAEHEADRASK